MCVWIMNNTYFFSIQLFRLSLFHFSSIFLHRFQRACTLYGVSDVDLFQTTDLWDFKNIALVTQTIFAIGRAVCIYRHLVSSPFIFTFEEFLFFCLDIFRHTSIQNSEVHIWDHVQLKKIVVISAKINCVHQKLSLACKLEQIVVPINQVKALVLHVKSFLANRFFCRTDASI